MLKISEIARRYNVGASTVLSWIEKGVGSKSGTVRRLAATRAGRSWRIEPEDLERFLQKVEADEPPPEPIRAALPVKIQRKINAEQQEAERLMADW